jgi:DNA-binding winged helix-turn-helix (wHTH) protein
VRVRFDPYVLDTEARQLLRGGAPVHLSPKAFDLLATLVELRPAVVEKGALRGRLWPGVHVVDATLGNLVVEIRGALEDDPSSPAFLRTAHGVGYAFSAEAIDLDAGARPEPRRGAAFWLVFKDRPIVLACGESLVGRDAACAVFVDAGGVSRRHARIRVPAEGGDGAVTIEDLDSTNGTYVQGRRVTDVRPLEHGDRIRIGRATLVFRARDATARTRRVRPPRGR